MPSLINSGWDTHNIDMEDGANISFNEFARDAMFEILGVDEEGREEVCRHRMRRKYERLQICVMCGKVFEREDFE